MMKTTPNQLREQMEGWRVQSPDGEGFHKVIAPDISDCKAISLYRLNLPKGKTYLLHSEEQEMNGAVIKGTAAIRSQRLDQTLHKLDSFFICPNVALEIQAAEDLVVYIAGALGEDNGQESVRLFDGSLPIGDIHQIHGTGTGEREVMFTCEPALPATRLICGLTWSRQGTWTSWPPHQHEKDLEEVYCYFDMDAPKMGMHISYLESGGREDMVVHPVQSGTMVLAPRGYHPTVAMPGTVNAYFWALAAFTPASRRYDLAVTDPELVKETGEVSV